MPEQGPLDILVLTVAQRRRLAEMLLRLSEDTTGLAQAVGSLARLLLEGESAGPAGGPDSLPQGQGNPPPAS